MKVQLVLAPSRLHSSYEVLEENTWPPMGILYIAAYLRLKMPDVVIKVTDGCKMGYKDTMNEINEFRPDILGISFYTMMTFGAMSLSSEIKRMYPSTTIVMGGPHATSLPVETLHASKADIVVLGEGEETFYQIVKLKMDGDSDGYKNLHGVCIAVGDKIVRNPPAKFITPLDSIPFPARDLVDMKKYRGWFLTKQRPETSMFFSRGCPYCCTFCSNIVWKSSTPLLRLRAPKNIVDEMEHIKNKYGINEIFDISDEMNNNYEHALEICKEIKERKLNMTWKAQLRLKPFTEELAKAMAEAGCWCVHLGVESGNQETIGGVKKFINLNDVEEICRILKKYKIKVLLLLMLFNVWEEDGRLRFEDEKMTENTLNFGWKLVRKNLVNFISWTVTVPYPGSKLYDIAVRHNLIKPYYLNNWEAWQQSGLFIMELPNVSQKSMAKIKAKGELVRIICLVKNRDFTIKNLVFMLKRALHIFMSVINPK